MTLRHDPAERRRAHRKQREKGCSVYIPMEVLVAVGIDPNGPPPYFRTWPGPKRKNPTVLVQFYEEA